MTQSAIKEIIESFLFVRRLEGWSSAFGMSWRFLWLSCFEFHRGFALRRSLEEPFAIPPPETDVTIREATLDDLALLGTIFPPLRLKRIARKLQAGEKCVIAIKEQETIAYFFAAFAGSPSTNDAQLRLGAREAYLWAGYALPQFRRKGVFRAIILHLCRLLQEEGYENAVLLVDRHNEAALRLYGKADFRLTDRVTFLRVLSWKWNRATAVEQPE